MKQLFRPERPIYIESVGAVHPDGKLNEAGWMEVVAPDYKAVIPDARLRRRMSYIIRMGVAAATEALRGIKDGGVALDAIITASGLGCLADTESFLHNIKRQEERALSPTPFISSTFNAIGAQIALLGGYTCYNTTYVQRFFSFESALLDALLLLECGEARKVLVGAVDEATETLHTLYKTSAIEPSLPLGEGASFFLLTTEPYSDCAIAEVVELMFSDEETPEKSDFAKSGLCFSSAAYRLYYACQEARETTEPLIVSSQSYCRSKSAITLKPL